MISVKNLTPSPFDLAPGVILPAFGEVEVETLDPIHLAALRVSPAVVVTESSESLDYWRDTYETLTGKKPHHLWKLPRLKTEIEGYTSL